MPSEYSSNGTGRCWKRTLEPRMKLSNRVPTPKTCTANGIDLASAETNRLMRTPLRSPNIGLLARKNNSPDSAFATFGALCRIRPRLRNTLISLRRSRHVANVDGSARERKRSPSSLSIAASIPDMPSIPASSASSIKAQHSGPQIRMTQQGADIRTQWQAVDCLDVFGGRRPRLFVFQCAQDEL